MIGKIEGETIREGKELKSSYASNKEKIHRILNIKILGFMEDNRFKRGIKELPLIDNTCYLLTNEQFNEIHNFVEEDDRPFELGVLAYDDGQIVSLGINKLFTSHIGIFGNTGSGKSYTLAKLFREVFKQFKDNSKFKKNAKFLLIDFNGEYIGKLDKTLKKYESKDVIVESEYKDIYELTTKKEIGSIDDKEKFPIHSNTLKDSIFWSIFLEATEKTQVPFLNRAIKDTYVEKKLEDDDDFISLIKDKIFDATSKNGKNIDRTIVQDFLYELASYLDNESLKQVAHYFKGNLFGGNEHISFYLEHQKKDNYSGESGFISKINSQFSTISDPVNIFITTQLSNFS